MTFLIGDTSVDHRLPGYQGSGYQDIWILENTRISGYQRIQGYLDTREYKDIWILENTRISGYQRIQEYHYTRKFQDSMSSSILFACFLGKSLIDLQKQIILQLNSYFFPALVLKLTVQIQLVANLGSFITKNTKKCDSCKISPQKLNISFDKWFL